MDKSLMDSRGESWRKRWTAGVLRSERYAVKGYAREGCIVVAKRFQRAWVLASIITNGLRSW